jgi:hypothetical protein
MAVHVIDTIKPKNGLSFPIVEDVDVLIVDSGKRLSEVVATMATQTMIEALQFAISSKASQSDLEALQAAVEDKADAADLTALEAEVDAKADSSALTTAAANLQAQIDNLVTPVTQDAEVQNARVGADGTSYQTLKARLDAEEASDKDTAAAIKDDLATITGVVGDLPITRDKAYINTSGSTVDITDFVTNNTYSVSIVDCVAGDKFQIKGHGGGDPRLWCFIDSSSNVLAKSLGGEIYSSLTEIIAPENAVKLIANFFVDTPHKLYKGQLIDTKINQLHYEITEVATSLAADIAEISSETTIENVPFEKTDGYYLTYSNGRTAASEISAYTKVSVDSSKKYYISTIITGSRGICFYHDDTYISGFNYETSGQMLVDYEVTLPTNCNVMGVCTADKTKAMIIKVANTKKLELANEIIDTQKAVGYKKYDFIDGYRITTPALGTADLTPIEDARISCCIIPCNAGDVFTINGTPFDNSGIRPYMFVDDQNTVLYRSGSTTELIDCYVAAPANGKLVINLVRANEHSVHKGYDDISRKLSEFLAFKREPITNSPDYMQNTLAYRPVGSLEKGYICLSCDDGFEELATYTIPMLIEKDVPCTFSLWSTSPVFTDYTSTVVDAINNHGCELSQHGGENWADANGNIIYTEEKLVNFFNSEKTVWDSLGLVAKSAVCPSHHNNALVRAVAGGRFGAVRSGYDFVKNHYDYYSSGARSNLYGMSSVNVNSNTLAWNKAAIDYAIANKKIFHLYWHDWDLSSEQRAVLEAVIDYAKEQNITFCTIGQIPYLT